MTNKLNGVHSRKLYCRWLSWMVSGEKSLDLLLPEYNCCDMIGAIEIASVLMPEVNVIQTYSGEKADVRYEKRGNKWIAFCA